MPMNDNNTVKRTFDLNTKPIVTAAQKARLDAVAAMADDDIDTSDAPFLADAVWVKAVDFPHAKKLISLRIDGDVIDFFRNSGARYQARMNAVLRSYVIEQKRLT